MKNLKILLFCICLGLLAGCAKNPTKELAEHNIIVLDKSAIKGFELVNVAKIDDGDGFIRAQAVLKNTTSKPKLLSYKVSWLDENGFYVESITSKWQTIEVAPKADAIIDGVAANASEFKIFIDSSKKGEFLNPTNFKYQGK